MIKNLKIIGQDVTFPLGGDNAGLKLKLIAEHSVPEENGNSETWIENACLKNKTLYVLEYYSCDTDNTCCMVFLYDVDSIGNGYRWDMFDHTGEDYLYIYNENNSIYISTNEGFCYDDKFRIYEIGGIE